MRDKKSDASDVGAGGNEIIKGANVSVVMAIKEMLLKNPILAEKLFALEPEVKDCLNDKNIGNILKAIQLFNAPVFTLNLSKDCLERLKNSSEIDYTEYTQVGVDCATAKILSEQIRNQDGVN